MTLKPPEIAGIRLAVGLIQGVALYCLYRASQQAAWPATDGPIFASLLAIAIFVPALTISGLGNLRGQTLVLWIAAATVLCVGLAAYDILREPTLLTGTSVKPRNIPAATLWLSLAACLFILHTLTVAGEADQRWLATYSRHFDVAWKHAVQFVLALGFLGVLWALLFLGAELFRLINIEFFSRLIRDQSFAIPVSALAFSAAIHVTDVRVNIVRGTRTLLLTLLAWLLPLMAVIGAGFIVALAFTGLEPLWATRRATTILLFAAAALVFLVNAVHQDGRPQRTVSLLGYTKLLATAVMVPLIGLAGYAVYLRIAQYGWTPQRIIALACVVVAAFYGIGYAVAAIRTRQAMRELEPTNLVTALVTVAVLVVLATPILDPAKISVADQVRRLEQGKVTPEKFDFVFLRFHAARFGKAALERLAARTEGSNAAVIAERARLALAGGSPTQVKLLAEGPTPETRKHNITVIHPAGAALPEQFVQGGWIERFTTPYSLPRCLTANEKCEAVLIDLDGDGVPEILLFQAPVGVSAVFKAAATGAWMYIGSMANTFCSGTREALRHGPIETADPPFKDLLVDGHRLHVQTGCPPRPPTPAVKAMPAQ